MAVGNYAFYFFVNELPEMRAAEHRVETRLRAIGDVASADAIAAAYARLLMELELLSEQTAIRGTEILREHERDSRVRPDTQGAGGPRLGDSLMADPLSNLLPGSVGLADEDLLDQNVRWWSTNEEGSSARLGGVLRGVFQPGDAAPDRSMFREHPIFQAQGMGAPSGVIRNAIPARRFIEHSIPDVEFFWRSRFEQIKAHFLAEIDTILNASLAAGIP
jgi:hypothetical protein